MDFCRDDALKGTEPRPKYLTQDIRSTREIGACTVDAPQKSPSPTSLQRVHTYFLLLIVTLLGILLGNKHTDLFASSIAHHATVTTAAYFAANSLCKCPWSLGSATSPCTSGL